MRLLVPVWLARLVSDGLLLARRSLQLSNTLEYLGRKCVLAPRAFHTRTITRSSGRRMSVIFL